MTVGPRAERTLEVARRVSAILTREGVAHAVVGSVAMALHGYVRATRDLDLGVLVPPSPRLGAIAAALLREGLRSETSLPAPDDDLGGVLTVVGDDFDPVQIVNFHNPPRPPPALVRSALDGAVRLGSFPVPAVDLPHLVALKLSTGAYRDELDVLELLEVRSDFDRDAIRATCGRFGLAGALERVLARPGR